MIMDLNLLFPPKAKASGCCMELALGITVLDVDSWSITCIRQPNNPFSHKCSSFLGIGVHPHCPSP